MTNPKTMPEFFRAMSKAQRERLIEAFKRFTWETAIASAVCVENDGRRRMDVPDYLRAEMSAAALDAIGVKQRDIQKAVEEALHGRQETRHQAVGDPQDGADAEVAAHPSVAIPGAGGEAGGEVSEWRWLLSNAFWPWKPAKHRCAADYFVAALWWLLLGQVMGLVEKWTGWPK